MHTCYLLCMAVVGRPFDPSNQVLAFVQDMHPELFVCCLSPLHPVCLCVQSPYAVNPGIFCAEVAAQLREQQQGLQQAMSQGPTGQHQPAAGATSTGVRNGAGALDGGSGAAAMSEG